MGKEKKIDLSNPGGYPKDWLDRAVDYEIEFSWWDDVKMVAGLIGLPLLLIACAAGLLYSLLKLSGKL